MNTQQKIIKNKLGLLNLAETLGNVSKACSVMGYSRDSFYRLQTIPASSHHAANLVQKRRHNLYLTFD